MSVYRVSGRIVGLKVDRRGVELGRVICRVKGAIVAATSREGAAGLVLESVELELESRLAVLKQGVVGVRWDRGLGIERLSRSEGLLWRGQRELPGLEGEWAVGSSSDPYVVEV